MVFKLIQLLQTRVVADIFGCKFILFLCLNFFSELITDEQGFPQKVIKIFRTMRLLEKNKHLKPMVSESFKELIDALKAEREDEGSIGYGAASQISGMSGISGYT